MATDAIETSTSTETAAADPAAQAHMSPRERAFAAFDRLGEPDDDGDQDEPQGTEQAPAQPAGQAEASEPDPLAELAAKVEERLKAKSAPPTPAAPAWDAEAYRRDPVGYLESLGLDVVETMDTLFEYANLSKQDKQARAERQELERLRQVEQQRQQQEQAAREAQAAESVEKSYLAHVDEQAAKYPHLAALDPAERLRYTYEVAQLVVNAGEDADSARLAQLTELHLARLAKKLPAAGAGGPHKKTAADGGRAESSADGGAPQTITNQLTAESGSPAERDLSPEGRRAAAMRAAATLGW